MDKYILPLNTVKFQQRIDHTNQDKYVKKLTTKASLLLFLHVQLQQREGLRDIGWRWQIELFFKWIKQHVKIKNFYGTIGNAVKNHGLVE